MLVLCGLCVRFAREGDDARSFAAAATAIVVFAPNVWLHSLTFLLLPLGVLRPRFDWLWLRPHRTDPDRRGALAAVEFSFFWAVAVLVAGWLLVRPVESAIRLDPAQD